MISRELLRQVVASQKVNTLLPPGMVQRDMLADVLKWLDDPRVLVLTGVRRCGKSTLLRQIMHQTAHWCYINFEDERLLDFQAQDFETLNEVLLEVYKQARTYFFDEIQNIDRFETFVRRLQDEGKKVVITGSNASLLSKEIGTKLTGRYKQFEVYPFSFKEYLLFKQFVLSEHDFFITERRVALIELFTEYLEGGGLPEYLKNQDKEYVRTLFENILYKDIITRYSIRTERAVRELVRLLATNIAAPFTYNALKEPLGLSNAITVKEYVTYLQNAYVFFELHKYYASIRRQLGAPRKIYLVDSSLHTVSGASASPNKGRLLENVVYLELKRRKQEIYYYGGKQECDFILKHGTRIVGAIQVSHTLDETNREREIDGLMEAMDAFKLQEGYVLTLEQSEAITLRGKEIIVMPVYRWMLETESY